MATKIILFATPFFFLLIFIELWVDRKKATSLYRLNDSLTSLSLGVISQTKKIIFFSFASIIYAWVSELTAIPQMSSDAIFTWVFSFILYDFLYYWYHRLSHQVNFLWASHVVHHQSEEYNLTTALRQTSSSVIVWLFYIPSFIIGVPAEVFFVSGALNLVYQFWVHTQLVGKLGWYESVFVTPSHHRVHHGQNQIYIDKNHGGVFILWDKLFGTFQEELQDQKVVYGVRRPVNSFNPIWANLHTWYSLFIDAVRAKNGLDKIKIWFMPTGWRPTDVEKRHPVIKQPAGSQIKYDPSAEKLKKLYALFQYVAAVLFAVIFIQTSHIVEFELQVLFWSLITLPLIANGFILEGRIFIRFAESFRLMLTVSVVYFYSGIFDYWLGVLIAGYIFVSMISLIKIFFLNQKEEAI